MLMTCHRDFPDGYAEVTRDGISPKTRKALEQVIKDNRWPILIYGGTGTGKTCAMAWYYTRWRGPARWYDAGEYCQRIQRCRRNGSIVEECDGRAYDVYEHTMQRIDNEPHRLVCIDDFGLRSSSDSVYEILLGLIDRRKGKPTIITSNRGPSELVEIYDERIVSRLLAGTTIEVTGPDQRRAQGIRLKA